MTTMAEYEKLYTENELDIAAIQRVQQMINSDEIEDWLTTELIAAENERRRLKNKMLSLVKQYNEDNQ